MKQRTFRRPGLPVRLLPLALAAALCAFDAAAARLALVVGNDNYQHASKLRNARNDAQSLARELEGAGFKVTKVLDANRDALDEAFSGFLRRVQKGDEVVFFFSGHGSQPPQLGPFLLPVDIRVTDERSVQRNGLSLESVVDDLNKRARFSLVIIDACRDDPFRATSAGRSVAPGSSLSNLQPPKGSMIIMAASKGQQALDRLSNNDPVPNGLFTRELIKHMRTPGLNAYEVLRRVRSGVEDSAATVNHEQRPALVDESSSEFFFFPPSGSRPAPAPPPFSVPAPIPAPAQQVQPSPSPSPATYVAPAPAPYVAPAPAPYVAPTPAPRPSGGTAADPQREFESWEATTRAGTRAAYESYLAQYPQGRYVPLAQDKLKTLGGVASPAPAAPAPAAAARPAANNAQAEFEVWDRAATSKRKADYEAYLRAYPSGRYVDLARAALAKL